MPAMVTIEGRVLGQRRPLFEEWTLALPPEAEDRGERLTLRALIERVVRAEVERFRERQAERRLVRALTEADIQRGLMKGKVSAGGSDLDQAVDADEAVATALLGFEDGLYYVFVDDVQQEELGREVTLRPESRVMFLRLVALAGG
jgi:hypothetical protein